MNPSASSSAQLGITVLRVRLSTLLIAHALLKLLVFTLPGTAQDFASIGSPGFLADPAFAAEPLGGIALWLLGDGAAAIRLSALRVPRFHAV
jgi:putative oxidoreductase